MLECPADQAFLKVRGFEIYPLIAIGCLSCAKRAKRFAATPAPENARRIFPEICSPSPEKQLAARPRQEQGPASFQIANGMFQGFAPLDSQDAQDPRRWEAAPRRSLAEDPLRPPKRMAISKDALPASPRSHDFPLLPG